MINEHDLELFGYYDIHEPKTYDKPELYSRWVERKIVTEGQTRLIENVLGLVGEAGEVAEKIKKQMRDANKVAADEIVKELGDVVFYATALANYYGKNLGVVLKVNVEKLDDREKRNAIKGEGDNR